MKSNQRSIFIFIAAFLISVLNPLSLATSAPNVTPINDSGSVWIVGTDVNGYGCWALSSSKVVPLLQVKVAGRWLTKAKAKLSKNSGLCSDSNYPWVATFHWNVDELGEVPHLGNASRDLMARIILPKFRGDSGFTGPVFVKEVYRSPGDLVSDYGDVLSKAMGSKSGYLI